jgi:hypothetical protein
VRAFVLAALAIAVPARADDAARIDWAKGLVIADGVGVADRHAPNPAVARGTSRRGAEEAAKKLIRTKLRELPLASGVKVGDKLADKAIAERLERAVDAAISLAAEPETDGAWRVTMAVPIEAVRQAIVLPRKLDDKGDTGPAIVVIDGVTVKPAVAYRIGKLDAPTVWVKEVPAWAKDAPHVKATRAKGGTIEIAGTDATAATLFVIVQAP